MAKSIGFFQKFDLTLERLSSALRCIQANPRATHTELAACMSVNTPIGAGFSAWLIHTGLAAAKPSRKSEGVVYQLTPFGQLAAQYDPLFKNRTQWIIHYYLSTEHAERSDAWLVFTNQFLTAGKRFSSDEYQRFFADVAGAGVQNQSALVNDPQSVLYTYTKPHSLGKLGLLRKDGKQYVSTHPNLPPVLVVGYVLLDWWEQRYDQTDTLRLSQLSREEGSLGRVFLADASEIKQFIVELSNWGYLNFAETQHEPVNRLYREPPYTLLERYYRQV